MVSAIKKPGRPPTGIGTPVQVRFPSDQLAALDAWIAKQPGPLSRPEAIRVLVADGLRQEGMVVSPLIPHWHMQPLAGHPGRFMAIQQPHSINSGMMAGTRDELHRALTGLGCRRSDHDPNVWLSEED